MLTQSAFLGKGMVMQPFQASPRAASQLTVCRAATQLKKTASSAGKAIKGPKKQPAPKNYLQYDLDSLDLNKAVNAPGKMVNVIKEDAGQASATALQPYKDAFGLARFRENELIHGRWAMLGALGVIIAEATTGVAWQDAGKVELDGAQYLGFSLPFSVSQLLWIEAILVGGAEIYRNTELNPERRLYPGGIFDPLGLASDPQRAANLKEAEIKHGRLAMVAFFGFAVQAGFVKAGALGSLAKFGESFAPELTEKIEQLVE